MAAVLSIAAIVAAGCGSSSKSKSSAQAPATPSTAATPSTPSTTGTTAGAKLPPATKQQLIAVVKPLQASAQQINSSPSDPNSYSQAATAFRTAASGLGKVTVPASYQPRVTKLEALLNQGATLLDHMANDVKNKDKAALTSDLQKFQAIGQQINSLKAH
jgi:hypothetical protein